MGWIKERIYVVGTEKGSKLDPRARELLESSRRAEGGGMEASIRGHGARHRTGSLSLSLAPLPLPTRLSGVFPPFCSSCTALLSLGGLLIGIETPPKPPRLLLARLAHPLSASLRSSALRFFLSSSHSLFSTILRALSLSSSSSSSSYVYYRWKLSEKGCNFSEDRDGKGLSRIFVEIFERFFPSIEFHETRTITFVTKFLKLESNHRELERKLQRIAKKFLFFSTTIITNYYNK